MAINPLALMKMKERVTLFRQDHPRVFPFFKMLKNEGLQEGTIFELKAKMPDGKERLMNFKLNGNDIETIQMLLKERGK